jgi:PAS domain S-box-containing protein
LVGIGFVKIRAVSSRAQSRPNLRHRYGGSVLTVASPTRGSRRTWRPIRAQLADEENRNTPARTLRDVLDRMIIQNIPTAFDSADAMREVIEAAPNGVVMIDASGSIILVNGELERMFGYPRSLLIGQPIEMLLPERFKAAHGGLRARYLEDPRRREMGAGRELFGRRSDGSEFPIEIGLGGIQRPEGPLAVASIADISARMEVEATFRNVVEAAPYGMVMVDADGKIIVANAHMTRLFGYTREELLGQSIELLVPERYRRGHAPQRTEYARAPSLRAMGANRDLTGQHKDGTEFPVEIGLNPVRWKGKTVSLAAVIDISVRKRLELELREANAHLEEFTYVASHDLKSPLRGISDLVEWLTEDLKDTGSPEVTRNLERIRTRVARMERIIDDLLTYAHARDASAELVLVDPQELVAEVLELDAPPKGFEVHVEVTADPFKAARTPLETVVRNLISNAVKHHDREQGRITIKMSPDNSYCHIEVGDDGPGIPSKSQERVFKLFQTVSNSERKGSGMGLALAKRLVESNGGKIQLVSSDNARGSTFHVWWPRFARRSPL